MTLEKNLLQLKRRTTLHSGFIRQWPLSSFGLPLSVGSPSDLFQEEISFEYMQQVFGIMQRTHWYTYLLSTSCAERLEELAPALPWPANVWMGVTVEVAEHKQRIDCLRRIGAAFKFVSFEPLIGDIGTLNLDGIDWVTIGGEIGANARPMAYRWVQNIFCQCAGDWRGGPDVPVHFSRWGEWLSHRLLHQHQLPTRKTEVQIIQNAGPDEIEVMFRVGKARAAGTLCPCTAYHPQFPKTLVCKGEKYASKNV